MLRKFSGDGFSEIMFLGVMDFGLVVSGIFLEFCGKKILCSVISLMLRVRKFILKLLVDFSTT